MPSFDVVSEIDMHELENAVQQAHKEVQQRYDFRGTDASVERTDEGLVLKANSKNRVAAVLTVLHEKCVKRGVSLKALDPAEPEPGSKGHFKQLVRLKEGISKEKAKDIVKFIKDQKLKVQGSIQGDQVRVTGKKRDTLQETIAALKGKDFELDLKFTNFRD